MTRAERIHHQQRAKARAASILSRWHGAEPSIEQIGKAAAMHNTCPCWMCTHHDKEHQRKALRDLIRLTND